jgi:hypothetical protein
METLALSGTELILKGQTSFEHIAEAVEDEQFANEAEIIVPFIKDYLANNVPNPLMEMIRKRNARRNNK